jgi:hypothetical protein
VFRGLVFVEVGVAVGENGRREKGVGKQVVIIGFIPLYLL